ncbi:MAG TPA: hypothetical protein VE221_04385 [Sphingomicrobium sp.]|nr:hypothetical protein [Sphingomicrobium sp.]
MAVTAMSAAISSLLLAASANSLAPSRSPPSAPVVAEQNIVVIGTKPTRNAVHNFIGDLTVDTDGHIAMFEQPICPASFGLPEPYNRIIEQRLREDAAQVGLRTAGERCDANVIVIVADSPAPFITELRRKRPDMFVGLETSQVLDILKTNEPVRTWQAIEPRGADDRPLERVAFINGLPAGPNAWFNPSTVDSRIQAKIKPRLVQSFVVIRADAADGLTLTQIADYAAMRTLARTRSAPALDRRSILEVIDGAKRDRTVDQLTAWDLAYLRALYRTSNGVSTHMQQTDMATAMKREFDETEHVEH